MKFNHTSSLLVASALLVTALPQPQVLAAPSASYLVVPGQSLGKLRLGQTPAQVHKIMGKPSQTFKLKNGLLDDLYLSKGTRKAEGQTIRDKVEILYRAGRAVQIEATSPSFKTANGLSTDSTLRTLKNSLDPRKFYTYGFGGDEPGGYLKYYVDSQKLGIAFESYGAQDVWAWQSGAATLIVHPKGKEVIPDQGAEFMSASAYIESDVEKWGS